ncbi:MAG: hypothetical protein AMXMBFR75_26330 [Candidatus Hinthialibacteria bacterium]
MKSIFIAQNLSHGFGIRFGIGQVRDGRALVVVDPDAEGMKIGVVAFWKSGGAVTRLELNAPVLGAHCGEKEEDEEEEDHNKSL